MRTLNPDAVRSSPLIMVEGASYREPADNAYRLACLELRGGNRAAVYRAELAGLNAWVSCRPLEPATSGGDVYYLSVCSQGSISRVTIADVAGHGESVGEVAERLRDALREHADHWDQSALIRRLNDGFLKGPVAGKYATAFLLSHYVATGELLFTNAGHLPPLWYHAQYREWTFMQDATPYSKEIADLPLGLIPGTSYTQSAVQLEDDDLLILYTDGVNEAENDRGEQLGLERLLFLANSLPTSSATVAGEALVATVSRFRGSKPPSDDQTIIALHRHATTPLTQS